MSEIYVKWKKMERISHDFDAMQKWLVNYADRVRRIEDTLQLSDNVMNRVRAKLEKEAESLQESASSLQSCSESLKVISLEYKKTEQSMCQ